MWPIDTPGKIVRLLVKAGDEVKARQGLVVVEAMKMENELRAARDGDQALEYVAHRGLVELMLARQLRYHGERRLLARNVAQREAGGLLCIAGPAREPHTFGDELHDLRVESGEIVADRSQIRVKGHCVPVVRESSRRAPADADVVAPDVRGRGCSRARRPRTRR